MAFKIKCKTWIAQGEKVFLVELVELKIDTYNPYHQRWPLFSTHTVAFWITDKELYDWNKGWKD